MRLEKHLDTTFIGRIERGVMWVGQDVLLLPLGAPGTVAASEGERARVVRLYGFDGLQRLEIQEASAGEIVALSGLEGIESATGKDIAGQIIDFIAAYAKDGKTKTKGAG